MSLRITDPKELKRLVSSGRLSKENQAIVKSALSPRKNAQSRLSKAIEKHTIPFSALPPQKPVELLYQRICSEYGRFEEGGEAVWELEVPFTGRGWRIDIALPAYCVAIESDGYEFHGRSLAGFKRDRQKQMDLIKHGWVLIRASSEQVRQDLDGFMRDIDMAIQYCQYNRGGVDLKRVSFDRCRLVSNPAKRLKESLV